MTAEQTLSAISRKLTDALIAVHQAADPGERFVYIRLDLERGEAEVSLSAESALSSALSAGEAAALRVAIRTRVKTLAEQAAQMVGDLYPRIVYREIDLLRDLYKRFTGEEL